jgi:hypothetical protein
LTITALAAAGLVVLRRSRSDRRDGVTMASAICWAISGALTAVAIWAWTAGPWSLDWGWLSVSVTVPYKPLSLAAVFAFLAMASGPTMRTAFQERSPLAFYLVATVVLFLCSLGPEPTASGQRVFYEPPYAWLMRLPFFNDTVRVPARFGMVALLAMAVAAGLAFDRIRSSGRRRAALLLAVLPGILGDGWMALPLPEVSQTTFRIPAGEVPAAVLELPLGDVWRDTAALYRSTLHGMRVVNGYNGFEPIYYQTLRRALTDRDPTALDALASFGPLLIAADKDVDANDPWPAFLSAHPAVQPWHDDGHWTLFRLPFQSGQLPRCASNPLAVAAAFDEQGRIDPALVADQNPATRWITRRPQRADDQLLLDLGRIEPVCGIVMSLGSAAVLYPGTLAVDISIDRVAWEVAFTGKMGGAAVRAALDNPHDARIPITLGDRTARFVRLRVEHSHPFYPWAVADVVIDGRSDAPAADTAERLTSN